MTWLEFRGHPLSGQSFQSWLVMGILFSYEAMSRGAWIGRLRRQHSVIEQIAKPVVCFAIWLNTWDTLAGSVDASGCILSSLDVFTTEGMVRFSPGKKAPQSSTAIFLSKYDAQTRCCWQPKA